MQSSPIADKIAVGNEKAGGQLAVRVFRSLSELEEIRRVWTLWNSHPNSDFDFYLLLAQSRPEIIRPHIIVLYKEGRPQAMLIGRILKHQVEFKIGYQTVLKPKACILSFIWGGTMGDLCRENSELMVREVLNSLRYREADLAVFNNIRADAPIYQSATRIPSFLRRDHFPASQIHRSLVLPASPEQFDASLSRKVRKEQKRDARKLMEEFGASVEVQSLRLPSDLEWLFKDVEEIAKKTYHRGLGVGFVADEETRRRLHLDAQNGSLRCFLLYLAGKPCAFWIGKVYQKTFHGGYVGFDPAYKRLSPGTFLTRRVIERFCDHNATDVIEVLDFGLGDAQYKQILCNQSWQDATVYIFGPSLRGLVLNVLRTPFVLIDQLAKRALEKSGDLQTIKRAWRDHARKE
jgi:CelD/BcsL family acetyltransferase involved in cellulose biosynthesis